MSPRLDLGRVWIGVGTRPRRPRPARPLRLAIPAIERAHRRHVSALCVDHEQRRRR